ncbi:hypothetical protein KI387_030491, partial [Taxus chinensis]
LCTWDWFNVELKYNKRPTMTPIKLDNIVYNNSRYLNEYYQHKWSGGCNDVNNNITAGIGDASDVDVNDECLTATTLKS